MPHRGTAARRSLKATRRVSKAYLNDLHDRLAAFQHKANLPRSPTSTPDGPSQHADTAIIDQHLVAEDTTLPELQASRSSHTRREQRLPSQDVAPGQAARAHVRMEATTPLTNPLAFHIMDWVPGPTGRPVFMGTSSSWAFSRRVLGMTHERLTGIPLSPDPESLLFDNHVYRLNWDGTRSKNATDIFDVSHLPSPDFVKYLINFVKFHCGQLFYLFKEDRFMQQLEVFQRNPAEQAQASPLWFAHYLLILAFGKSFVVQSVRSQSPPGAEHFIQAMQCMPDLSLFDGDPIEMAQVLCCAALYLQCGHRRGPAYRMIGTALRWALDHGMYTGMRGPYLDEAYVQRCSLVWWTVYALERRMSSLLGVPMGISEESISAPFPSISGQIQGVNVLEMQVVLCQILVKVDLTVYGSEGKLDSRYLSATQSVLRDIAKVTEQLNRSFDLYANSEMGGISRISAHLHLLEHQQCIILTTRPLLYIFLQSKLGHSDPSLLDWLKSGTVHSLLHICLESAQQILRILSNLLEQGLLETFLPFDVDATSISTMPLIMAAAIDPSLLSDHAPWSQRAYAILDEMHRRGNLAAKLVGAELRQLDTELGQLVKGGHLALALPGTGMCPLPTAHEGDPVVVDAGSGAVVPPINDPAGYATQQPGLELGLVDGFTQHYELSPDQLLELANSLDVNSLAWPFAEFTQIAGS
ncbi:fungal specific transcription factor domain-containing protein [Aspergillus brunneoviolaceus CBS 621.78]|uniref:Uncharacterized protein n=1 Tax=Aspergillus brunneoviolaceus CBS 621.78 TaxID=1450534 RepID=A0ACD1GI70_9EURO|nr:hypothetical protein BO95DRAFT_489487 [Aspergillus brunneoviolaceus CBS 621.78]RAH48956.1 hypothetical protein BO95DRAFT_489487 [Aspergillus brunneoviolaceus CBS 621.78]